MAELLGIHLGSVDTVGDFLKREQPFALFFQAFQQRHILIAQRMSAPGFGKAADQHGLFRLDKQNFHPVSESAQIGNLLARLGNVYAGTHIDADRQFGFVRTFDMVRHQRRQHFQGQVVHAKIAQIFHLAQCNGFARAGKPANQDDFHDSVRFL